MPSDDIQPVAREPAVDAPDPVVAPEYAPIGIDSDRGEWSTDDDLVDPNAQDLWLRLGILPPGLADTAHTPTIEALIGRAVLVCRLYWGWSQKELERRSKVDQSTISRLERGLQKGLSLRRLFAILTALRVVEVLFEPRRPSVAPTALELMLHGDPWTRALRRADERLNRRRSA